jgi:transcriptional regulator with XRE-family HTH domain
MRKFHLDEEAGNRLRLCRQLSGLSIEDVATRLCMVKSRYQLLEKSFSKPQQDLHLDSLAAVLGASAEWISTGQGAAPVSTRPDVERRPMPLQERQKRTEANEKLAQRARLRRIQLGMSAADAACALKVTRDAFMRWEESLSNVRGVAHEANWEQLLKVPRGWLRDDSTPAHADAFRRLPA